MVFPSESAREIIIQPYKFGNSAHCIDILDARPSKLTTAVEPQTRVGQEIPRSKLPHIVDSPSSMA